MILGLLSDTHSHAGRAKTACQHLLDGQPGAVIHCGDIGSESVLTEMASIFLPAGIPVYAVLGNVDLWNEPVEQFPSSAGVTLLGRTGTLELDGSSIGIMHGDDSRALQSMIRTGQHDYVFKGHTHLPEDYLEGSTRVINPGAVTRALTRTVALLDLDDGRLRTIELTD